MARKFYSEDQIAHALDMAKVTGSLNRVSKQTGIARATLRNWMAGKIPSHTTATDVASAQDDRLVQTVRREFLEETHAALLEAKGKRSEARYIDLLKGAGIANSNALGASRAFSGANGELKVSLVVPEGLRSLAVGVLVRTDSGTEALPEPSQDATTVETTARSVR